ncbi:TraB/GumN family protein [Chitinophaga lutea]
MNRLITVALSGLLMFASCLSLRAQSKKYQGLLWEISGNGLKKPSYLFGTMHVSNKLAFHLSDSFYHCIRNADIVALETDPQRLQEDFSRSNMLRLSSRLLNDMNDVVLTKDAFSISPYNDLLRTGLTYRPEMINHLLYRSFAAQEDFEEDTFLDMYIYQVGSKLGKKATGVERFDEAERLMLESYRDAANDKKARKAPRDAGNPAEAYSKLNDAYRRGDLDMLDSISGAQYTSPLFLEKFLYKRNENMFHSIDSIIRRSSSLFAGVGAAHLPGERGLIQLLRKAGYQVRPVSTANRDSEQKEQLEKMTAPVVFQSYTSEDGWIQAEVPGKLYNFSSLTMLNQLQYADLANGAYYLISRIRTNALSLGQTPEEVLLRVDSLLYENIPGRIISKKEIHNNGFRGFDITNRTRRGDLQRYQIFITPFETIIFKISGNGEYAGGEEAQRFMSSIRLKPLPATQWSDYTAPSGEFRIRWPHAPAIGSSFSLRNLDKRQEYEAYDTRNGNSYLVVRKTIPDYEVLEEDTTDIGFAEESFALSSFIKRQQSRQFITWRGYPCLESVWLNNDNSFTKTRILLQGPHYYLLAAHYRKENAAATGEFFQSFVPALPAYNTFKPYTDTSLYFSVQTAVQPEDNNEWTDVFAQRGMDESNDHLNRSRTRTFRSDSTGEEVQVTFEKFNRYYSTRDSAQFWKNAVDELTSEGDRVVKERRYEKFPGWESLQLHLCDTNTLRSYRYKVLVRAGAQYTIASIADDVQGPSAFARTFFDTFAPADTLFGTSVYESKASRLFTDFYSADSLTRQQARSSVRTVNYKNSDAPELISMIRAWNVSEKNYLDVKSSMLQELGHIRHASILPFLREAYEAAGDTSALQHSILQSLLRQRSKEGNALFNELVLREIPVFTGEEEIYDLFQPLYDSLELATGMFPSLLELTALTDYKAPVYNLLATMADSGLIDRKIYEAQLPQIAFDARIAVQKQLSAEQSLASELDGDEIFSLHSELYDYAVLLLPYREQNKNAGRFFARVNESRNPMQQTWLAQLYLRNKQPVNDSILQSIAAQDRYRAPLWTALQAIGRLDKFPDGANRQESLAQSLLVGTARYSNKPDSVVWLSRHEAVYRFRKGAVHLYKYKVKDDDTWYLAISGMQPLNTRTCNDDNNVTALSDLRYVSGKPLSEQFNKLFRQVKYKRRRGWDGDGYVHANLPFN